MEVITSFPFGKESMSSSARIAALGGVIGAFHRYGYRCYVQLHLPYMWVPKEGTSLLLLLQVDSYLFSSLSLQSSDTYDSSLFPLWSTIGTASWTSYLGKTALGSTYLFKNPFFN